MQHWSCKEACTPRTICWATRCRCIAGWWIVCTKRLHNAGGTRSWISKTASTSMVHCYCARHLDATRCTTAFSYIYISNFTQRCLRQLPPKFFKLAFWNSGYFLNNFTIKKKFIVGAALQQKPRATLQITFWDNHINFADLLVHIMLSSQASTLNLWWNFITHLLSSVWSQILTSPFTDSHRPLSVDLKLSSPAMNKEQIQFPFQAIAGYNAGRTNSPIKSYLKQLELLHRPEAIKQAKILLIDPEDLCKTQSCQFGGPHKI